MGTANRHHYRRWVKRFFGLLAALLAVVVCFNLSVDGVGGFRLNAGLKYAATSLIYGKMVAGPLGVFDERELQRLIVEEYPKQRDVIAIGSSRSMSLRGRFICGNPDFFNHSVAGARLEDYLAIIDFYREKGLLPGTIILGLDPWTFNRNNGLPEAWKIHETYYSRMVAEILSGKPAADGKAGNRIGRRLARYGQLINLENTMQNWEYLRRGKKLHVTDSVGIDDFVREPDGSIHFPLRTRVARMEENPNSRESLTVPKVCVQNFDSLHGTDVFEGLVRYLVKRGVKVVFLILPFHPDAYQSCRQDPECHMTLEAETYLRNVARRNNTIVIGSIDPGRLGFKGDDFFDAVHGHETVMKRLFETEAAREVCTRR
jgi:hypothetical protein